MIVIENKSEYRALVSVANSVIPSFDASPVLIPPGGEEKWLRDGREPVVVMTRHGWFSCHVAPDGYLRVGNKNLYVVADWMDMDSHFYAWFDNPETDFEAVGFPFSVTEVAEICDMEANTAKRAAAKTSEFEAASTNSGRSQSGEFCTSEA